jgi:hypothetical protein
MKYIKEFSSNSNMRNLTANIAKFRQLLINAYGADNLTNGNLRHYPNQPNATDIETIAISLATESQGIISENYLFQILESDYKSYRQTLPDRSNYNQNKRALQAFIDELSRKVSDELNIGQEIYIIDSIPLP